MATDRMNIKMREMMLMPATAASPYSRAAMFSSIPPMLFRP